AFFESIKYLGHLLPLSFLRIYMGYYFLGRAIWKFEGDYLLQPRIAAAINEYLPQSDAPLWYKDFLENVVVPNWQVFAYSITYCEFIVGLSFIVGFLIRPVSLIGILLSINFIYNSSPSMAE